jgi:Flp pilus assembly protein TadG
MTESSKPERTKQRQRGHAILEAALAAPWMLFLFAGALDMGFYEYSLISAENAARVAAIYTSSNSTVAGDSTGACTFALRELNSLPNTRALTTCGANPVTVTATAVTGVDGNPASNVSVRYQTDQLIPIPGLMGKLTVIRTVQMRVKQ